MACESSPRCIRGEWVGVMKDGISMSGRNSLLIHCSMPEVTTFRKPQACFYRMCCTLSSKNPSACFRPRAQVLKENVIKFGPPDIVVTNNFATDYARTPLMFDVILTDVPCSGEGMFRKDEQSIGEWSRQNVFKCQQLQRQILTDIWPCLRPGGLLIYSTCTFNQQEDEDNVEWICNEFGAIPLEIPVETEWHVTGPLVGALPVCRFIPGISCGEGLFMAALRKPGVLNPNPQLTATAMKSLRVLCHGVEPDRLKGKKQIPDITKVLMVGRHEFMPKVELDYADAIAYLRHDTIQLPSDTPRGYVAVSYKGLGLGLVNNIGNRADHCYSRRGQQSRYWLS